MPYEPYLHGKLYMQILQGCHFEHRSANALLKISRLKTLAGKATVLSSRRNWHIIRCTCMLYCVMCVFDI